MWLFADQFFASAPVVRFTVIILVVPFMLALGGFAMGRVSDCAAVGSVAVLILSFWLPVLMMPYHNYPASVLACLSS